MMEVSQNADDHALVKAFVERGDREAMEVLFSRHRDMAYRTACRVMRNPSEAEDATQAAFVKVMRSLPQYRGSERFRVWMLKVVVTMCKNHIRTAVRRRDREHRAIEREEVARDGVGEEAERQHELAGVVKRLLDQIPERYRGPVWLHYYEGLPFRDVGQALSVSENTARTQARRGLNMLRSKVAGVGLSVPVSSILAAFPLLPVETAPSALARAIESIAQGTESVSRSLPTARAPSAGARGAFPWLKVTVGTAVLLGSAAVVGSVAHLSKHGPVEPAVTQTVQTSLFPFEDRFENGLDKWEIPGAAWGIAPGKGVDGSDCLRVTCNDTGGLSSTIWMRCAPDCEDFEVRFKIYLATPRPAGYWLGLWMRQDETDKLGQRVSVWRGVVRPPWAEQRWRQCRYVIRGEQCEWWSGVDGRRTDSVKGGSSWVKGRRPGLKVASYTEGAVLYIDDVVVIKLDAP